MSKELLISTGKELKSDYEDRLKFIDYESLLLKDSKNTKR